MKIFSLIVFTFVLGILAVQAQENDSIPVPDELTSEVQAAAATTQPAPKQKKGLSDKLYFGGYFNFSFGSNSTTFGVEPMIGYKLIPRLSLGAKFRYDYINYKDYDDSHGYGASIFSRLMLIKQLYVHVEYAGYNYEVYDSDSRLWVPFLFVGAGFNQRIGSRTSLNAQILFDVLQNENSPYRNWEPLYSVGVSVGF